jgi:CRISPR-associated protein Cmr4
VGVLAAGPSLRQGTQLTAGDVLKRALPEPAVLQLGGKATVGRGRCRLSLWPGDAKEARP